MRYLNRFELPVSVQRTPGGNNTSLREVVDANGRYVSGYLSLEQAEQIAGAMNMLAGVGKVAQAQEAA